MVCLSGDMESVWDRKMAILKEFKEHDDVEAVRKRWVLPMPACREVCAGNTWARLLAGVEGCKETTKGHW